MMCYDCDDARWLKAQDERALAEERARNMLPCACTCCSSRVWLYRGGDVYECEGCGCKAEFKFVVTA